MPAAAQADGEEAGREGAAAAAADARPSLGGAKDSASSLDTRPLLKEEEQRAGPGSGLGRAGSGRSASSSALNEPESSGGRPSLLSGNLPPQQQGAARSASGTYRVQRPSPLDTSQPGLAAHKLGTNGQLGSLLAQLGSPGLVGQNSAAGQVGTLASALKLGCLQCQFFFCSLERRYLVVSHPPREAMLVLQTLQCTSEGFACAAELSCSGTAARYSLAGCLQASSVKEVYWKPVVRA